MFTLKVTCQGEIHHVQVKQWAGYAAVELAIQQRWPGSIAKYRDEDGDLCTLSAPTFSDFLVTAKEAEATELVLKLEVSPIPCPSNSTPQKHQAQKKIKEKQLRTGVWEEDPRDIAELARLFEDAPTPAQSKGIKRRVNAKVRAEGRRGTEGAGGAAGLGGGSRSATGTDSEAEPGAAARLEYRSEGRKDAESVGEAAGPDGGIEPATEEAHPEAGLEAAARGEDHGEARQARPGPPEGISGMFTLSESLELLSDSSEECCFVVHHINKLPCKAGQRLHNHFSQYGAVVRVLVTFSQSRGSYRPNSVGFIQMASKEVAQKILRFGEEEVAGVMISMQPFVRKEKGGASEISSQFRSQGPSRGMEAHPEAGLEAAARGEDHGEARQARGSTDAERVDNADRENDEGVSWDEDPAAGSGAGGPPSEQAREGRGDDGPPTPQLWPSTPEPTPPPSPRLGHGGGRILWMAVPAWVPVFS